MRVVEAHGARAIEVAACEFHVRTILEPQYSAAKTSKNYVRSNKTMAERVQLILLERLSIFGLPRPKPTI
jgi:hypothetical protein